MNHPVRYIHTAEGLARVARALAGGGDLAVDCEAAGYHRYSDRLCLVQLSTRSETFVLDPLAADLGPHLRPHLEDPARRVLMHGGSYDLRLLRRDLDISVARLADTQVAAGFLGEPATGLQTLLDRHLGVRIAKKYQRADWARRPLSRDMIDYAAGDTRHLHRLAAVLEDALRDMGRLHWAEEECRWLVTSAAETGEPESPPDPVTRFKGARRMDARTVTALREAIAWRDRNRAFPRPGPVPGGHGRRAARDRRGQARLRGPTGGREGVLPPAGGKERPVAARRARQSAPDAEPGPAALPRPAQGARPPDSGGRGGAGPDHGGAQHGGGRVGAGPGPRDGEPPPA